jgi:protein SCO1/2
MTSQPAGEPATEIKPSAPRRPEHWFSALVGKPWFWVVGILLIIVGPLGRAFSHRIPPPPTMKIPLPAFELTDERGQPFGTEQLLGRVWVADFVFTSCPTVCPKLTTRMVDIQHRSRHLGEAFHLVTFTVDPENDTPERLAEYARAYHANGARWSFLTGPLDKIESTVVKGFKIAMGKEPSEPGSNLFSIFHGENLVLVDQEGNIRGYYEANEVGEGELLRVAGILANQPQGERTRAP